MAKKPNLQSGEYGIRLKIWDDKVSYRWLSEVFTSVDAANEHVFAYGIGEDVENCVCVDVVDAEGKIVGGCAY